MLKIAVLERQEGVEKKAPLGTAHTAIDQWGQDKRVKYRLI